MTHDCRMGLPPAMLAFMNGIEPTPSKRSPERVVVSEEERKARLAMDVPPVLISFDLAAAPDKTAYWFPRVPITPRREPAADAEGWIPWAGGECPIPYARAREWEALSRGGQPELSQMPARADVWRHHNLDHDIVAYRLTTKEQS